MSIPLVQNNEKDSINTSIIAIKRQIERINALLGLSNSEEIDTSVFATKTELEDAVTQVETDLAPVDEVTVGNMQSVTSNAVAGALPKAEDISSQISGKVGQIAILRYGKVIQIIGYLAKGTAGEVAVATGLPKPKYNSLTIYGQSTLGISTMYVSNQTAYVVRNATYNCLYNLTYIAE